MITGPESRVKLLRRYYQAYETGDLGAIESVLHEKFTFSSPEPEDDRIGQAKYFQRCWPQHERITKFDLLDVCVLSPTPPSSATGATCGRGRPFTAWTTLSSETTLSSKSIATSAAIRPDRTVVR